MADHKLSILTFPQRFDGTRLHFNVLIVPRNLDPLAPLDSGKPTFAKANLRLVARLIPSPENIPTDAPQFTPDAMQGMPPNATVLYEALAAQFKIVPATEVKFKSNYIKKYLPNSYRQAFNFSSPSSTRALVDDTYRCAMRNAPRHINPNFKVSSDTVTWGQIFAFCLRQPLLARQIGLIRSASIELNPNMMAKESFLYVDLASDSPFADIPDVAKKYGARIPILKNGEVRSLFAPVQFPIPMDGSNDVVFQEVASYDDGFGKIVHANQPLSIDFLEEIKDEEPPTREIGIQLGWDDEQLLTWFNRQMEENPDKPGSKLPLDFPMGVFGSRIDVREAGATSWASLCAVKSKTDVVLGNVNMGIFSNELGVEVHPVQINGDQDGHYWLPQYFAHWNGKSMVLPDSEATTLYRAIEDAKSKKGLSGVYQSAGLDNTQLQYGRTYEFRVRYMDQTGGGPSVTDQPVYQSPAPIGKCHFRRFVAPQTPVIDNYPASEKWTGDTLLVIRRPPLEYPAVVYTRKYPNAVQLLQTKAQSLGPQKRSVELTLPDPDVTKLQIDVEVESFLMDNLSSISRKEPYIHYYTTFRSFPALSFSGSNPETPLQLALQFKDVAVLDFNAPDDNAKDIMGTPLAQIHQQAGILLPTSRRVRLTLRAVGEPNPTYYGRPKSHIGKPVQIVVRKEASVEQNLLLATSPSEQLTGIFLQPDPIIIKDGDINRLMIGYQRETITGSVMQRLADELGLPHKGLTLMNEKGRRIQFGCSSRIRHTVSPDHTSITFSNTNELTGHWIVAVRLELNRDWTWDGLLPDSITIKRRRKIYDQNNSSMLSDTAGEIQLTRTASMNDLHNPNRSGATLIFFDAIEPQLAANGFPVEIEQEYSFIPNFKQPNVQPDPLKAPLKLRLPVTTPPSQVPEIRSAGLAMSPYMRDEKYTSSEPRQTYVWIELDEPLKDPNDALFGRVLAYAPDPILTKDGVNYEEENLGEPSLPIDPEWTRTITPGQTQDNAGLNAMQLLSNATDSDRHFLLPLPPGLHAESPELFGFFTYEFRVGHQKVWSTAQGRFGRPLRATGIQHPAPHLLCSVRRTERMLFVEAPYSKAVWRGRNVTANPPRTEIWALLYAQVAQADGNDFRNILLDERKLNLKTYEKDTATIRRNVDRTQFGMTSWFNREIKQLLNSLSLKIDTPISVLCVEMMPRPETLHTKVNVAG